MKFFGVYANPIQNGSLSMFEVDDEPFYLAAILEKVELENRALCNFINTFIIGYEVIGFFN